MPISLQQGHPNIKNLDPKRSKPVKTNEPLDVDKTLKRKEKQLEVASYIISMQAADCEQKDKTIQLLKQELNTLKEKKASVLNFFG